MVARSPQPEFSQRRSFDDSDLYRYTYKFNNQWQEHLEQLLNQLSTVTVKVSPIALGGISIGSSWSSVFGKNEDPFTLLDAYYNLGGNFIDTSNVYNSEESEKLVGHWMEERGVRDQMVVATKYSAGYKSYDRENIKFQSIFTGNSAKSMHVSVRDSLKKLKTDYIDLIYVHWWDCGTSVEEVMNHLHTYVQARKVLYLGISDAPAWVVMKANAYARQHGLTPFSVYQGRWNAAFRDIEAEIIPMCEDQGMAIMPWAALGGGQLISAEQRKKEEEREGVRPVRYSQSDHDKKVCDTLEEIADARGTTLQAVALSYLLVQSSHVFPIVGVNTVDHVKAIPAALSVQLTKDEVLKIQSANSFDPLFPMNFLYNFKGDQAYNLGLGPGENQQFQMSAWIQGRRKQWPYHQETSDE